MPTRGRFTEADLAEFRSEVLPDRPEGKSCRQTFSYAHPWEVVAKAYNRRYPKNDRIPVLLGSEIVEQTQEDGGTLQVITRVVTVDIEAPGWLKRMLKQYDFKFNHKVTINYKTRTLTIRVTNITYEGKVTLIEDCMYKAHDKNPDWTHFEQTALLKLPNFPLSSVCEQYMIASYDRNTKAGRLLDMEFIQDVLDSGYDPKASPLPAQVASSESKAAPSSSTSTPVSTPAAPSSSTFSSIDPNGAMPPRTPKYSSNQSSSGAAVFDRMTDKLADHLQNLSDLIKVSPAGILVVLFFGAVAFIIMLLLDVDALPAFATALSMQTVSLLGLRQRVRSPTSPLASPSLGQSSSSILEGENHLSSDPSSSGVPQQSNIASTNQPTSSGRLTKSPSSGFSRLSIGTAMSESSQGSALPDAAEPKSRSLSNTILSVSVVGWVERLCAGKMQAMFLIMTEHEISPEMAANNPSLKAGRRQYTTLRTIKELGSLYDCCKEAWGASRKRKPSSNSQGSSSAAGVSSQAASSTPSLSSSSAQAPSSPTMTSAGGSQGAKSSDRGLSQSELSITEPMVRLLQKSSFSASDLEGLQAEVASTDSVPNLLNEFFEIILQDEVIANSRFLDAFFSPDASNPAMESMGGDGYQYLSSSSQPSEQVDVIVKKGQLSWARWRTAWRDVWMILNRSCLRAFPYRNRNADVNIPLHSIIAVSRVTGDLPFPGWFFMEIKTATESFYFCSESQPCIIEWVQTIKTEVTKLGQREKLRAASSSGTISGPLTGPLANSLSAQSASNAAASTPQLGGSGMGGSSSNLGGSTGSTYAASPGMSLASQPTPFGSGGNLPSLSEMYQHYIGKKEHVVLNRRRLCWDRSGVAEPQEVVETLLAQAISLYEDARSPKSEFWTDTTFATQFVSFAKATSELQGVRLHSLEGNQTLVFFVNLYHLMVIHILIEAGAPTAGFLLKSHFQRFAYEVDGLLMTPFDVEHQVLRRVMSRPQLSSSFFGRAVGPLFVRPRTQLAAWPTLDSAEPRLNFVLHCGAASSPRGIPILRLTGLEEQLRLLSLAYLNDAVIIASERKAVTLPKVIEWYERDFTHSPSSGSSAETTATSNSLIRALVQYLEGEKRQALEDLLRAVGSETIKIRYSDYDWTYPPQFLHK
eukprot:TRINITY_DN586_c0_g3_i1.p1 TRINITY_DN586_c0_g3~~TRINITY_DN586_c0_g3_i1.p1  ORF type:complete len:1147 (+),score=211.41 TRINITY_DN586_c0_g3_i1:96-3536(+)